MGDKIYYFARRPNVRERQRVLAKLGKIYEYKAA